MSFKNVVGHHHFVKRISLAVAKGTLPQSLILSGPSGVGKQLVATSLAQVLNCLQPVRSGRQDSVCYDACGSCGSCQKIVRGVHPDVIFISVQDDKSRIETDQVRQVIGQSKYRPFEGKKRVVVIIEADKLTFEAQNALLKSLEEPPDASQFILVAETLDVLLATVRSRCQCLAFGRLDLEELCELLVRDHNQTYDDARAMALLAEGSAGRALSLGSKELVTTREASIDFLNSIANARDTRMRLESAENFVPAPSKVKKGMSFQRKELELRFQCLESFLRDMVLIRSSGDLNTLSNIDFRDQLMSLSNDFVVSRAVRGFSAVDEASKAIKSNANPKVVIAWLACQL
tara:strand:- start:16218 stop:17255 length:1038 start_codon:yes stop_codon:yes gene_type:complete